MKLPNRLLICRKRNMIGQRFLLDAPFPVRGRIAHATGVGGLSHGLGLDRNQSVEILQRSKADRRNQSALHPMEQNKEF